MPLEALKVGELARRTGLTIRTLHHYDEIGLLKPSLHTGSGHRLYSDEDVARLQQVISLRQLGFSLEEVRSCLNQPGFSPIEIVSRHVAHLREQVALQRKLCERLEAIAAHFRAVEKVSTDEFILAIEVMTMIETYYTPEQMEYLNQRRETIGEEVIQQGTADWANLFAELTVEMERGTDPADPKVQVLEQRRQALVNAFTGGNAGIERSLTRMWTEQGDKLAAQHGYDPKLLEYLGKVAEAAKHSTRI